METKQDDLVGMSATAAKEYLFHHIAALKLAEKTRDELLLEQDKWKKRAELARSRDAPDLAAEAEQEAGRVRIRIEDILAEITDLRGKIEKIQQDIPALAARERNVDPDLLEQELLIILGKNPGDETADGSADRAFKAVEADAALEALKAKMGQVLKDQAPTGAAPMGGEPAKGSTPGNAP